MLLEREAFFFSKDTIFFANSYSERLGGHSRQCTALRRDGCNDVFSVISYYKNENIKDYFCNLKITAPIYVLADHCITPLYLVGKAYCILVLKFCQYLPT